MIGRRKFISGVLGVVAAPAIVRVSSLMPVSVWSEDWLTLDMIVRAMQAMAAAEFERQWTETLLWGRSSRLVKYVGIAHV